MFKQALNDLISEETHSSQYRHYLDVRDRVLGMIDEMQQLEAHAPSEYWQAELAGLDYMLDASPLIIRKLREHCYHLTGLRAYDYREHHEHKRHFLANKLALLRQQDNMKLLVPESPLLGGFGYTVDGNLYNLDTLKFYECLIALQKAGLLDDLAAEENDRKIVVEIGGGWGGFAYQLKTLFPEITYVIIDLPQAFLFSAVYLKTLFPAAQTFIHGGQPATSWIDDPKAKDFIFLPHYLIDNLKIDDIFLVINMVSFQEMTSAQVDNYVSRAAQLGCPNIYSLNRDRSRHNPQLTAVSDIISNYYHHSEIKVLDLSYLDLPKKAPLPSSSINGFQAQPRSYLKKVFNRKKAQKKAVYKYKHLVGTLK
jgi:putative sugar O-methyltransferase